MKARVKRSGRQARAQQEAAAPYDSQQALISKIQALSAAVKDEPRGEDAAMGTVAPSVAVPSTATTRHPDESFQPVEDQRVADSTGTKAEPQELNVKEYEGKDEERGRGHEPVYMSPPTETGPEAQGVLHVDTVGAPPFRHASVGPRSKSADQALKRFRSPQSPYFERSVVIARFFEQGGASNEPMGATVSEDGREPSEDDDESAVESGDYVVENLENLVKEEYPDRPPTPLFDETKSAVPETVSPQKADTESGADVPIGYFAANRDGGFWIAPTPGGVAASSSSDFQAGYYMPPGYGYHYPGSEVADPSLMGMMGHDQPPSVYMGDSEHYDDQESAAQHGDVEPESLMGLQGEEEPIEEVGPGRKGLPQACLFVASLSSARTDEQLLRSVTDHFIQWGPLAHVKVLKDWMNRPYAFVQFENVEDAKRALVEAHNTVVDNRHIRVEQARVNRTLFIAKFNRSQPESVRPILEQFGPVEDLTLLHNYQTGKSKGCGFVKYCYREDAIKAAANMERGNVEVDLRSIFVGQLNQNLVTSQLLDERFRAYGAIESLQLVNKHPFDSRPAFAFITYAEEASAERAVVEERAPQNAKQWLDRTIRVQYRETGDIRATTGMMRGFGGKGGGYGQGGSSQAPSRTSSTAPSSVSTAIPTPTPGAGGGYSGSNEFSRRRVMKSHPGYGAPMQQIPMEYVQGYMPYDPYYQFPRAFVPSPGSTSTGVQGSAAEAAHSQPGIPIPAPAATGFPYPRVYPGPMMPSPTPVMWPMGSTGGFAPVPTGGTGRPGEPGGQPSRPLSATAPAFATPSTGTMVPPQVQLAGAGQQYPRMPTEPGPVGGVMYPAPRGPAAAPTPGSAPAAQAFHPMSAYTVPQRSTEQGAIRPLPTYMPFPSPQQWSGGGQPQQHNGWQSRSASGTHSRPPPPLPGGDQEK
ncbi:hypothetical protein HDU96_006637 [Phlyctochytrium bullatum]|nr:hypothetical protein HDU96_006637 [Phlyctochytrium bullatum]